MFQDIVNEPAAAPHS